MKITIDPYAGFCGGVKVAIKLAEKAANSEGEILSLGDLVHNGKEMGRLARKGVRVVNRTEFINLHNTKLLFRAHGEPPESYEIAKRNNVEIVDGTCGVVRKLQHKVQKSFEEMQDDGGQLVIFGKKDHPEVIGLNGYANNKAIIVSSVNDLDKIDCKKPIRLFAQTTMSVEGFEGIVTEIMERITRAGSNADHFKYFNSICGRVSGRVNKLRQFAAENDVVIFVSGKESSNGKYLFDICKSANDKSYFVSGIDDLDENWFVDVETVAVSGATSTPQWLMEDVQNAIEAL